MRARDTWVLAVCTWVRYSPSLSVTGSPQGAALPQDSRARGSSPTPASSCPPFVPVCRKETSQREDSDAQLTWHTPSPPAPHPLRCLNGAGSRRDTRVGCSFLTTSLSVSLSRTRSRTHTPQRLFCSLLRHLHHLEPGPARSRHSLDRKGVMRMKYYLVQWLGRGVRGLLAAGHRPPAAPGPPTLVVLGTSKSTAVGGLPGRRGRRGTLGRMRQGPHLGLSKAPSAPSSLGHPKTVG